MKVGEVGIPVLIGSAEPSRIAALVSSFSIVSAHRFAPIKVDL